MSAPAGAAGAPDGGEPAVYDVRSATFSYAGSERPAIRDLDVRVERGDLYGVIGPNGSGKSTLLRLLLGGLEPDAGRVRHAGRPVSAWGRRELARRVGVVPQHEETAFPLTVRELVAMGRYPHLGAWRSESADDRRAVTMAMERCDLRGLAGRPVSTLSGGERQLARVARALAQEPSTLVLDEPTVSLDIRHEMEIFGLLRELSSEGVTVVLVTHSLNAAARVAGRLLMLREGAAAAEGAPHEVLTREAVERAYGWPVRITRHPGPGPDAGAPQVIPLTTEAGRRS